MLLFSACTFEKKLDSSYYCQKLKLNCIKENRNIFFITSKGNFEVELFGGDNPVTVSNFIENIKKNIYRNKKFYKLIQYPHVKIIHAGINPENNFYDDKNKIYDTLNPSIPLEIKFKKDIEPRYHYQIKDPSESDELVHLFESGYVAMVKKGEKNSSSTEFFFITDKFPELNGRYSVFGKIINGFEVLNKIEKKDFIYQVKIIN